MKINISFEKGNHAQDGRRLLRQINKLPSQRVSSGAETKDQINGALKRRLCSVKG